MFSAGFDKGFEMSGDRTEGDERSGARKRARKIILCATGAYIVYSLAAHHPPFASACCG